MVQLVRCLPCKHEDLILVLNTHGKARCGVCLWHNPGEKETGGSLGLAGQPAWPTQQVPGPSERPCLKISQYMAPEVPHLKLISDIHIHGHQCPHVSIDPCVLAHM